MRAKVEKIIVCGQGYYLGMEKGCFVLRDREGNITRYPLFENEIGEIVLTSGNFVSTSVLASCGFWGIPVVFMTRNSNSIAVLRSLDDDSHVKTRLAQYEALHNGKGITIAKTIVLSKIKSQNMVLRKHGLKELDLAFYKSRVEGLNSNNLRDVRRRLLPIEGKASEHYYHEIFKLMPFKADKRKGWKAYDGLNNTSNLAYTMLKFRVYMAVFKVIFNSHFLNI